MRRKLCAVLCAVLLLISLAAPDAAAAGGRRDGQIQNFAKPRGQPQRNKTVNPAFFFPTPNKRIRIMNFIRKPLFPPMCAVRLEFFNLCQTGRVCGE